MGFVKERRGETRSLRQILGVTEFEHKRNEEIRAKTGQCTVAELVTRSRLRWLGHVVRMPEGRLPPQLLYGRVHGPNKVGRPVGRWRDMIESDLKKRKVQTWYNVAQERVEWRKVVHGESVRGRRKQVESKEAIPLEEMGVRCPRCGKLYRNNRGGWFSRHVEQCGEGSGGRVEPDSAKAGRVSGGGELKCPKCGKIYRSKAGGWYARHTVECGSSQEMQLQ